jgi:hypothetical protein
VHVEIIKYDIIVELKEAEGKIHEPQALVKEFYDAKKENRVIVVHIERPERPTFKAINVLSHRDNYSIG